MSRALDWVVVLGRQQFRKIARKRGDKNKCYERLRISLMYLAENEPSHGQMDTKRRPRPRFAPYLGFSPVLFGNPFDESQSKSPSSRCFFLFISSIKRFEETHQLLRWNRGPRIPYFQHNCVSLDLGAQLHFTAPCAVLDGVARKIEEGSLNEVRITLECG